MRTNRIKLDYGLGSQYRLLHFFLFDGYLIALHVLIRGSLVELDCLNWFMCISRACVHYMQCLAIIMHNITVDKLNTFSVSQ